jgi:hypothetical protein
MNQASLHPTDLLLLLITTEAQLAPGRDSEKRMLRAAQDVLTRCMLLQGVHDGLVLSSEQDEESGDIRDLFEASLPTLTEKHSKEELGFMTAVLDIAEGSIEISVGADKHGNILWVSKYQGVVNRQHEVMKVLMSLKDTWTQYKDMPSRMPAIMTSMIMLLSGHVETKEWLSYAFFGIDQKFYRLRSIDDVLKHRDDLLAPNTNLSLSVHFNAKQKNKGIPATMLVFLLTLAAVKQREKDHFFRHGMFEQDGTFYVQVSNRDFVGDYVVPVFSEDKEET